MPLGIGLGLQEDGSNEAHRRQGDITGQEVDAVVNAANRAMRGGGGVDGAIHRAGGPAVLEDCKRRFPDGLATGRRAGRPPARWRRGGSSTSSGPTTPRASGTVAAHLLLRDALAVADELGARTIAFPLVSAGIYGWPKDDAVAAAVETLATTPTQVEEARIVAFDAATYELLGAVTDRDDSRLHGGHGVRTS